MNPSPCIVWLRRDLRLDDNPALHYAAATGAPVVAVFILDPADPWRYAGAQSWWLHHALASLADRLHGAGVNLILRRGDTLDQLQALVTETGAGTVCWNRRYEPWGIATDTRVKQAFHARGLTVESFNANLLAEPWHIVKKDRSAYKVFTPYWHASEAHLHQQHLMPPPAAPEHIAGLAKAPASDALESWGLLPRQPDWAAEIAQIWRPTEQGAQEALSLFIEDAIGDYARHRDFPAIQATSRLSPYLAFGQISPRQIRDRVIAEGGGKGGAFLRQLFWREFSYYMLFHYPQTVDRPLNPAFAHFPWRYHAQDLKAWQRGRTGYPLVDAGMRQLWRTGWMHNRVRLVAASFLVKHLLLPWQEGAKWFQDTLLDADLANNVMGWQWVAGSGADAAPYFRIFNPVLQSEKFDGKGAYLREFVPELKDLPDRYLHAPWTAPAQILEQAGIVLGKTYPFPIVDHAIGRRRALDALKTMRLSGAPEGQPGREKDQPGDDQP